MRDSMSNNDIPKLSDVNHPLIQRLVGIIIGMVNQAGGPMTHEIYNFQMTVLVEALHGDDKQEFIKLWKATVQGAASHNEILKKMQGTRSKKELIEEMIAYPRDFLNEVKRAIDKP